MVLFYCCNRRAFHRASYCSIYARLTIMPTNRDIFTNANELIKEHGEDASIYAAMMADELLDQGDMDGVAVWKRILKAVDELLSEDRPEGTKVH